LEEIKTRCTYTFLKDTVELAASDARRISRRISDVLNLRLAYDKVDDQNEDGDTSTQHLSAISVTLRIDTQVTGSTAFDKIGCLIVKKSEEIVSSRMSASHDITDKLGQGSDLVAYCSHNASYVSRGLQLRA
jgi:hypothetical protein